MVCVAVIFEDQNRNAKSGLNNIITSTIQQARTILKQGIPGGEEILYTPTGGHGVDLGVPIVDDNHVPAGGNSIRVGRGSVKQCI